MNGARLRRRSVGHRAGGGGSGATIWDDNFDTGSSIDTAGTRFASAKPWTLYNAGLTTYAVSGGQLIVTPEVGIGAIRGATMGTLPAGDWAFETKVDSAIADSNFAGAFLMLYEASSGYTLHHGIGQDFGFKYQVRRCAPNWGPSYGGASATHGVPVWLDVARVGANLTFRYSTDGIAWTTVTTVAQTADFVTAPDYVGFSVWQRTAVGGNDEVAVFEYFHKTS